MCDFQGCFCSAPPGSCGVERHLLAHNSNNMESGDSCITQDYKDNLQCNIIAKLLIRQP